MMNEAAQSKPSRITPQDILELHLTKPWQEEDPCFERLVYLYLQCRSEEPDQVEGVRGAIGEHEKTCGGCFRNVFRSAMETKDPVRRNIYIKMHELAGYEFMKFSGGDYQITNTEESTDIRLVYPPENRELWIGLETHTALSPGGQCWLTIDVLSEEDFRNPGRLLDGMDRLDVAHMKDNDDPRSHIIQWFALVSDQPHELRARWEGRVKKVANGATLLDRYGKLVAVLRGETPVDRTIREEPLKRDSTEEVLALRALAFEYDGTSRFSSFLRARVPFRQTDAYRHGKLDRAHSSHRAVPATHSEADPDGKVDAEDLMARVVDASTVDAAGAAVEARHEEELNAHVLRRLTGREKDVFRLKLLDLNVTEIAQRLGVARETVSRDMSSIREKVGELLGRTQESKKRRTKNSSPSDHT